MVRLGTWIHPITPMQPRINPTTPTTPMQTPIHIPINIPTKIPARKDNLVEDGDVGNPGFKMAIPGIDTAESMR